MANQQHIMRNLAKFLTVLFVLEGFLFGLAPQTDAATQNAWRWRNDDGTEAAATWAANEDTAITGWGKEETKRLRFGVNDDGSESGFVQSGQVTFQRGSGYPYSSFVDSANEYAYIGGYVDPASIVKFRLSDSTIVESITVSGGVANIMSAAYDPNTGYGYFGTYTSPGQVVKVSLSDMRVISTLTLESGENLLRESAFYAAGHVYFGTWTSPAQMVKIRTSDFTRVGSLTLGDGVNYATGAAYDSSTGMAYVADGSGTPQLAKINISTFTHVDTVTLTGGAHARIVLLDDTHATSYAYVGSYLDSDKARLFRVELDGFTESGYADSSAGEYGFRGGSIDTAAGYAYFGTWSSPGYVVKMDIDPGRTFEREAAIAMSSGEEFLTTSFIDTSGANDYVYFGISQATTRIVKVDVTDPTFSRVAAIDDPDSAEGGAWGNALDPSAEYLYSVTTTGPCRVIKTRVSDMVKVDSLNLSISNCIDIEVDTAGQYLYTNGLSSPTQVSKVRLSDLTEVSTLTFDSGEDNGHSMELDDANDFGYIGTEQSPAKILKFRLSDMTRIDAFTLDPGEENITSATIDATNGYIYFGTSTNPGLVIKADLSNFGSYSTRTLSDVWDLDVATIDVAGGYVYFGTGDRPGKISKLPLDISSETVLTLTGDQDNINGLDIDITNGFLYAGTASFSAAQNDYVIQIDLATFAVTNVLSWGESIDMDIRIVADPQNSSIYAVNDDSPSSVRRYSTAHNFQLEYGRQDTTCSAVSTWQRVAYGGSGGAFRMADSPFAANLDATTNVGSGVSDGGSSFVAGKLVDATNPAHGLVLDSNEFTEMEWAVEPTVSAIDGATYCFRMTNDGSTSNFIHSGYAEATLSSSFTPTTSNAVTLARLSAGDSGDFSLSFDLDSTLSGTLTVTLPEGFTVNSAATAGGSSACLGTFGYNAQQLTAEKTDCSGTVVIGGANVTNPSSSGSYTITWVNDDPGEATVFITDDDNVSVTSNVDPTLTFDIDIGTSSGETPQPYLIDFGQVDFASPESSDNSSLASIWLDFETNATAGGTIFVRSANAAMKSTSTSDEWSSSTASLAANTEKYGICVDTTIVGTPRSGHPGGTSWLAASPYNTSCTSGATMSVGALQTSDQTIMTAAGPLDAGLVQVRVGMSVASSTPAHPDYQDILTFTAVATY